jgi:putative nucleotidyltransferase with HDIG domain
MKPFVDEAMIKQVIKDLPLLSPNVSRLLQVLAREDYDLDEVIAIVKYDAALTARVLRAVNSPVYGLLNEVSSVDRAIAYLGKWVIISIVMSDQTGDLFTRPLEGYGGRQNCLWRHDLFAAFACREVARFAKQEFEAELAFTAGLLHDIGKFVFSPFWKEASGRALEHIEEGKVPDYCAAERALAGMDHARIGYEMACHWQFPEPLRQAILFHHAPREAPVEYRALAFAVHLGDICAMMAGCDTGSDGMRYQLDAGYTDYFDITSASLAEILLETEEQYRKAESSLAFE